mgnify:CR=1 FL=1
MGRYLAPMRTPWMPLLLLVACGGKASDPTTSSSRSTTEDSTPTGSSTTTPTTTTAETGRSTLPTGASGDTAPTGDTAPPPVSGVQVCAAAPYSSYDLQWVYVRRPGETDDGIRYTVDPVGPCLDIHLAPGDYEIRAEAPYCAGVWADVLVEEGLRADVPAVLYCYG